MFGLLSFLLKIAQAEQGICHDFLCQGDRSLG